MVPALPEGFDDGNYRLESSESSPEFVGAPTEFAEAEEVPEVISAGVKVLAGIAWLTPVVVTVLIVAAVCVACLIAFAVAGMM